MTELTLIEIESAITAGSLSIGVYLTRRRSPGLERLQSIFSAIAQRKRTAILISAVFPVALRLVLLPAFPVPHPVYMDESANLLQADTFALGRLANPPHAMAEQLETFEVLMRPTYASFRPPGASLFMWAGQVLVGSPWAGVCLTILAFCAANCWMLQGWMPPGWSLYGALISGLWLGVFGFWMNSYWGGAPAALGGCLVFGALPRIKNTQSVGSALLYCLGIAILSMTRAYEGLFVILPVSVSLGVWLVRDSSVDWSGKLRRVLLPIACGIVAIGGWTAYYNWRVTGDPHVTPYLMGRNLYNIAPPFLFQKASAPLHYRNEPMRQFYEDWELPMFNDTKTLPGYIGWAAYKVMEFWRMYIRPELTLPLLLIPIVIRRRGLGLAAAILATAVVGLAVETWGPPYYYAPITGVLVFLLFETLRFGAENGKAFKGLGRGLAAGTGIACAATAVIAIGLLAMKVRVTYQPGGYFWIGADPRMDERAWTARKLEAIPGKHLVLVRYPPTHNEHFEWVWNRADVDGSKIVWARLLDDEKNRELIRYFSDRHVWLVQPQNPPTWDEMGSPSVGPTLEPYNVSALTAR